MYRRTLKRVHWIWWWFLLRTIKIHWVEKVRRTVGWGVKYWIIKGDTHKSVSHPVSSFTNNFKDALDHVQLFTTPQTVACQTPLPIGLSRQEYWSQLPFPPPGDLPEPGIEPMSPSFRADSLLPEPPGKPQKRSTVEKRSGTSTQLSKSCLL